MCIRGFTLELPASWITTDLLEENVILLEGLGYPFNEGFSAENRVRESHRHESTVHGKALLSSLDDSFLCMRSY